MVVYSVCVCVCVCVWTQCCKVVIVPVNNLQIFLNSEDKIIIHNISRYSNYETL